MSVTPLTAVLTLTLYCEIIASALGFEQTIKTRKILCYGINGGYFTDGRNRDFRSFTSRYSALRRPSMLNN